MRYQREEFQRWKTEDELLKERLEDIQGASEIIAYLVSHEYGAEIGKSYLATYRAFQAASIDQFGAYKPMFEIERQINGGMGSKFSQTKMHHYMIRVFYKLTDDTYLRPYERAQS